MNPIIEKINQKFLEIFDTYFRVCEYHENISDVLTPQIGGYKIHILSKGVEGVKLCHDRPKSYFYIPRADGDLHMYGGNSPGHLDSQIGFFIYRPGVSAFFILSQNDPPVSESMRGGNILLKDHMRTQQHYQEHSLEWNRLERQRKEKEAEDIVCNFMAINHPHLKCQKIQEIKYKDCSIVVYYKDDDPWRKIQEYPLKLEERRELKDQILILRK